LKEWELSFVPQLKVEVEVGRAMLINAAAEYAARPVRATAESAVESFDAQLK